MVKVRRARFVSFVSFVAWWSPELFGAAVAFVVVVLVWPLTSAAGLVGLIAVTQVVWVSLAGAALLVRIVVTQLVWAVQIHRVRAEQAAARATVVDEDQADTDSADAEEVAA